jgi:hypothetical protein
VPATFSVATSDGAPDDGLLDFGTHRLGSAQIARTITITNLTGVERTAVDCFPGGGSFSRLGDCPASLPANGTATLTVRFTPDTLGDPFDAATLGLSAFGSIGAGLTAHVVPTQLRFSATELAFPETLPVASVQQSITLTNIADDPLVVPVSVTGTGFSALTTDVTVPANASIDVSVAFSPPAAGSFTGTLELGEPSDPDHLSVPLSGTGTSPSGGGSDGGVGGNDGGVGNDGGIGGGGNDGGVGGGDDAGDGGHHGGGCSAGSSARGVLPIAWLALLLRRRRRPTVTP